MKIDLKKLDQNLVQDLTGEGIRQADIDCREVDAGGHKCHLAFVPGLGRGGIVLVGSGADGVTHWTDAASADEVLARYLADDMTG